MTASEVALPYRLGMQGTTARLAISLVGLFGLACTGVVSEPGGRADPGGGGPSGEVREDAPDDTAWAPAALLTTAQYEYAIADLLGVEAEVALPAENRADHFINNAHEHVATALSEELRVEAAGRIAAEMSPEELEARVGCLEGCTAEALRPFLRRAFRGEVPREEREAFAAVVTGAGDPVEGLRLLVEVVLLSPQFLYRIEGATEPPDADGLAAVDAFTLASRLSFLLWASGPDEALLDLAESGELLDDAVVAAEVRRMIADPRFGRTVSSFHGQWLALDAIDVLEKAGEAGDQFDGMGPSWRRSLDAHIAARLPLGLEALLTSSDMTLTSDLAPLYGLEPTGEALGDYAFPEGERAGLLTHPAMMAKLAYADQDSPIARGVFVMERFLCVDPPAPPADVDLSPPPVSPDSTSRERFEVRTGEEPCASCHRQFNPIGYLFGGYDAYGRFATETSSGRAIDTAAELRRLGPEVDGDYVSAVELTQQLSRSDQVRDCVADQWVRYGLNRPTTAHDARTRYLARQAFRESAGDFEALLTAIATGPGIRLMRAARDEGDEQ